MTGYVSDKVTPRSSAASVLEMSVPVACLPNMCMGVSGPRLFQDGSSEKQDMLTTISAAACSCRTLHSLFFESRLRC